MNDPLAEIEESVCDIAAAHLSVSRAEVVPTSRLIEDLHCDSLDLVELIMILEERFSVAIPQPGLNPVYKSIFTRRPFRLRDLAELVYLQQGTGKPRRSWRSQTVSQQQSDFIPFSQLGGQWRPEVGQSLWEHIDVNGKVKQFRRRSDGMRCLLLPSAQVEIGCNDPLAQADEKPLHLVEVGSFLIDAEPVSTMAYCRFLNSIQGASVENLTDWFVLSPDDHRKAQIQLRQTTTGWQPVPGTEQMPMVLVSWFGANAYSLWANGAEWSPYCEESGESGLFLPSEAQWEYAARGLQSQLFPFGVNQVAAPQMNCSRHRAGETYQADTMPLSPVHAELGMSPFGLHHMAGNVWQWCRDWYSEDFYSQTAATEMNPVNRQKTGVRSERGGSWVGPAELCRSSYRRGRSPTARGRCLGFRCVHSSPNLKHVR